MRLRFTQAAQCVGRNQERKKEASNLRSVVEAIARSVKHPFLAGKLPVWVQFPRLS